MQSETTVHEIAEGIYRISTPVPPMPGLPTGFTFNQFLVRDDEPLLFHTGLRQMFPVVRQAIERVLPAADLRWIAFSHFEADECGALNELLAVAPRATPVCSRVNAGVSVGDYASRPPRALADGEKLRLGRHEVEWLDTPHLPHNWETGYLFETATATLLCGDLFTQPGTGMAPLVETDILGPSEEMRAADPTAFAYAPSTRPLLAKLAERRPTTLACMHGSSWRGNGAKLLHALADRIAP